RFRQRSTRGRRPTHRKLNGFRAGARERPLCTILRLHAFVYTDITSIARRSKDLRHTHGSEWGPVVLPVFKIGRSPLTRGGWVRLPGASASLRSPDASLRLLRSVRLQPDVNNAITCSVFERSSRTMSACAARSSSTEWLPVATAIDRAPPAF